MPDLWFIAGLAIGVAITGFCAVGSFDRGADSVRRKTWALELAARQRAVIASLSGKEALIARRNTHHVVIDEIDRVRQAGDAVPKMTHPSSLQRAAGDGIVTRAGLSASSVIA
jgi:hypothetical protein